MFFPISVLENGTLHVTLKIFVLCWEGDGAVFWAVGVKLIKSKFSGLYYKHLAIV